MKFINKTAKWIRKQYYSATSPKFRFEIAEDIPALIPEWKILIIADGIVPDSLAFKCPCGCDTTILLNLLADAKPRWKYCITKRGNISISPSIWRKVGCKSHFIIREGRINWVKLIKKM
jgi:hypothetical protein